VSLPPDLIDLEQAGDIARGVGLEYSLPDAVSSGSIDVYVVHGTVHVRQSEVEVWCRLHPRTLRAADGDR
jgi:hypothetical protein